MLFRSLGLNFACQERLLWVVMVEWHCKVFRNTDVHIRTTGGDRDDERKGEEGHGARENDPRSGAGRGAINPNKLYLDLACRVSCILHLLEGSLMTKLFRAKDPSNI